MRTISIPTTRTETNFEFDLSDQDLLDINDIMKLGSVAWDPVAKKVSNNGNSVPVFRIYTHHNPAQAPATYLKTAKSFPIQPGFHRCVTSTGNLKLLELFRELIEEAIAAYGKPFSTVSCLLGDTLVIQPVHSTDADKSQIINTYYWSLTNKPLDCSFFLEEDGDTEATAYTMFKHGMLQFDAARPHGVTARDGNMRFFIVIDSM